MILFNIFVVLFILCLFSVLILLNIFFFPLCSQIVYFSFYLFIYKLSTICGSENKYESLIQICNSTINVERIKLLQKYFTPSIKVNADGSLYLYSIILPCSDIYSK